MVFRGDDACAVARAVREAVGDGIVLPSGPYRYPYAGIVQLLRAAGLFHDPTGDTATDPVLSREALTDLLRELLPGGGRIGVLDVGALDRASAVLLGAFAETAQLAAEGGFAATGVVLGAPSDVPEVLQLPKADIRDTSPLGLPPATPSANARRVLALVAGAPHPVHEDSLATVTGLSRTALQSALRELAAADYVEIGVRVGLGPARLDLEPESRPWLETIETRLPAARLAVNPEPALAWHLAREAWSRSEPQVAIHCFSLAGGAEPAPADEVLFARALAATGNAAAACELLDKLEDNPGVTLQAALLAADLAACGVLSLQRAEKLLRRAERSDDAVAARAARSSLLLKQGKPDAAFNLLRRTTKPELELCPPDARLEHELAVIAAASGGADKHRKPAETLCVTRAQRRRLALAAVQHDPSGEDLAVRLAAEDLDAPALRDVQEKSRIAALAGIMQPRAVATRAPAATPGELFQRLREHGATVLAALVGDSLEIYPPGAQTRPGLASQLDEKLRRLRAHPHAVSFARDEFAGLGPFRGGAALALTEFGNAGPLIVVFRGDTLPAIEHLLESS
ncbi:MAG: hypothetical protein H6839_10550 [Planctomycetes bacterium]|nr:hypothetical protein [Planctomycetota bacterium]